MASTRRSSRDQAEGMRASMRDRILAAAVSVMRERGVTNTTTKEIARVAGVAEGSIYNHFANKTELVAACMAEVAGGIREALARLSGRAGEGTVEANLAELAEAEIAFFTDLLPIVGPVLGDHELRAWLRQGGPHGASLPGRPPSPGPPPAADRAGSPAPASTPGHAGSAAPAGSRRQDTSHATGIPPGPVLGHVVVAAYLEAERRGGRLAESARPAYLAASIIGACQQYAFMRLLTPSEAIAELAGLPEDPAEYARAVVGAVMAGHVGRSGAAQHP